MEGAPKSENNTNNNSEWDSLSNFANEANFPPKPGETPEEHAERLKWIREETEKYRERNSEFGPKIQAAEAKLARYQTLQQQRAERRGKHAEPDQTDENIAANIRQIEEELAGYRQSYQDSQAVGTPEEQARYEEWLEGHDAENQANLEATGRSTRIQIEGEEDTSTEEGKSTGEEESEPTGSGEVDSTGEKEGELTETELEDLIGDHGEQDIKEEEVADKRARDHAKKQEEIDEAKRQMETPLTAINANFSFDEKDLARQFAEKELNEEVASAKGFIKKLWKGTLFKKYYQKKYEREILSEERKFDFNGEQVEISDVIADSSDSAIARFIRGATEEFGEGYIHSKAGEKLTEASTETTEALKTVIEKFAQAKVPEDGDAGDIKRDMFNAIARIKAEARDRGETVDEAYIDNYFEVAEQARERVEHGIAIEKVMEGFKVYNAEVRNNLRSDVHRDSIDIIVNKCESSAIGQFVPPEIIAAALGSAVALTQTGARAAAGLGVGMAVSGALAGLRERNRVTEDRARMMRDAATGNSYEGVAGKGAGSRAKYEANLGGTLYDMQPADELTENLNKAIESGDSDAILGAIAEARVRVDFSDSEQKDLISYSSAGKLGDERLQLDIALIKAEKSLSEEDKAKLETMKEAIQEAINQDVDEKDKDFRNVRLKKSIAQAGKTIVIGSGFFFISQELTAAIDPGKLGIFEKAGLLNRANNEDASETILANLVGGPKSLDIEGVSGDDVADIERYKAAGFKQIETSPAHSETIKDLLEVSPAASTAQARVIYDGWADNGTTMPDFNELRTFIEDGHFGSGMFGSSTMNGESFDYQELVAENRIKGYVTVGGAKFEVVSSVDGAGNLTWGENGVFTTPTGETIKAIGDNGEKLYQYFEVAVDNGVDADGVTHIIPLATDTGENTFNDSIQQVVETSVDRPATYGFYRDVSYGGVFPGVAPRTALGSVSRAETPGEPTEPTEEPVEEPTEPTEEPVEEPTEPTAEPTDEQPTEPTDTPEEPTEQQPTETPEEPTGPTSIETAQDGEGEQNNEKPDDQAYVDSFNPIADLLGPDGLRMVTMENSPANNTEAIMETAKNFEEWWHNSLSRSDRAEIINILRETENLNTRKGSALRTWLDQNPQEQAF